MYNIEYYVNFIILIFKQHNSINYHKYNTAQKIEIDIMNKMTKCMYTKLMIIIVNNNYYCNYYIYKKYYTLYKITFI